LNDAPETYSERRRIIGEILEPLFDVSSMVPTNNSSSFEPGTSATSLLCSWADRETRQNRTLSVYVDAVSDGAAKADDVRQMIRDETVVGDEATELAAMDPGQYVFALDYLGRLTAIVGTCVVDILPFPVTRPLTTFADAAIAIARKVGCSPYVDDFTPPTLQSNNITGAWSTADGWMYDPRTPPTQI
jgi:hypothetical protein